MAQRVIIMNQIIEDILCYPAMYVLHSMMGISVFFNVEYWTAHYSTLFMSTALLIIFLIWSMHILRSRGRKAITTIMIAPLLYWVLAGLIALPIELFWHGTIERRFYATHDYTIAFHPFCRPILMDFELVDGKWIEQGPGYFYSTPLELSARSFAHQLHLIWITAIWALLAIAVNVVSLVLTNRWSKKIGDSLTIASTVLLNRGGIAAF